MSICVFCRDNLFTDPRWMPESRRAHHTSVSTLKQSVEASCVICTVLAERFASAVQSLRRPPHPPNSGPVAKDEISESDLAKARQLDGERVRTTPVEQVLVDWLSREGDMIDETLPIYEASFQDDGGRNAWLLRFHPIPGRPVGTSSICVVKQDFIVYGVEYDDVDTQDIRLEDNTSGEATFAQIEAWRSSCKDHAHCQFLHQPPKPDDYVPTRLLRVGTESEPTLYCVDTNNRANGEFRPYITLSYKWGFDPSCLLDASNYDAFYTSIDINQLPATFRDAVHATRKLRIPYLWIDALCMLQKDAAEWLRESPHMQEVYSNASLSLAASSGNTCEQGLFRARRPAGVPPAIVPVVWAHEPRRRCQVNRADFWAGELLAEPLYCRGWVLQERLLAPRVLHFHKRQVLWQCPSLTASEALPRGLGDVVEDERRDELRWRQLFHRADHTSAAAYSLAQQVDLADIWRFVVEGFTRCDLTKSSDKLMAIAGVAKQMRQALGEKYVAGLWEKDLVEQLAWRVTAFRPPVGQGEYRAPSWSWVSVDGEVSVPPRVGHRRYATMEVRPGGLHLSWEDAVNEAGAVFHGSLTVETELYRLMFRATRAEADTWDMVDDGKAMMDGAWCRFYPDVALHPDVFDHAQGPEDDARLSRRGGGGFLLGCTAALLAWERNLDTEEHHGLALALRVVSVARRNVFTRIGLIEFRGFQSEGWDRMQNMRKTTAQKAGEVAASNDRSAFRHIIVLL